MEIGISLLIVVPFCHYWLIKHSRMLSCLLERLFLSATSVPLVKFSCAAALWEESDAPDKQTISHSSLSPHIHKSPVSLQWCFIFITLKWEFVQDSVDYWKCAEQWITNKVHRKVENKRMLVRSAAYEQIFTATWNWEALKCNYGTC